MDNALCLHLTDLHLTRGGRRVLQGLHLKLRHGERLWLCGANGSGKTTLAECVAGLRLPDSGGVTGPARVGYSEQEPRFPQMATVRSHLLDCGALAGWPAQEVRRACEEALEQFGLHDSADRRIGELSRGWRQRLNLARGWLGSPELWVLDEPYIALDAEASTRLTELVAAFAGACLVLAPRGTGVEAFGFPEKELLP